MKKLLLTALVMLGLWSFVKADGNIYGVPRGGPQSLANADYRGIDYATSSFTNQLTTVALVGQGVVYGAVFSTGNAFGLPDFVDVYDATSAVNVVQVAPMIRIYNGGGFNYSLGLSTVAAGFFGPPWPIRFNKGLFFKPSSAGYNTVNLLYYLEP